MMNSCRLHIPEHLDSNSIRKQHPPATIGGINATCSWLSDLTNAAFHLLQAHSGERSCDFFFGGTGCLIEEFSLRRR